MTTDDERIIRVSPRRLGRGVWERGRAIQSVDGRTPDVTGLRVDEADVSDRIAALLNIPGGERVVRRRRVYEIDGRPVQAATSHLPLGLVGGSSITQADTGPGGTYARLAELGHAPVHFTEDVIIRAATSLESDQLGLRLNESIIDVTRIACDDTGRIVEVTEMTLHPQRYQLRYEFDA